MERMSAYFVEEVEEYNEDASILLFYYFLN